LKQAQLTVCLVVIDSGGVGAAPDAGDWGDDGANTIGHALAVQPTPLPHLAAMGLSGLTPMAGTPDGPVTGSAVRCHPVAAGKDTLAGHWEMMASIVTEPFRTFPNGFPAEVVARLETAFGRPLLGNRAASGTVIIEELGPEHLRSGQPIVYTSADSVLQIAAHESVVSLEQLYAWCEAARAIMVGPNLVGRIIARPFVGRPGAFVRTPHRHDYAVPPPPDVYTAQLEAAGVDTVAIGKIWDIFSGVGFRQRVASSSNADGLAKTLGHLSADGAPRLVFVNLVDFDSKFGHRRDPVGYAHALGELDAWVPTALERLGSGGQLWITEDHGCDPTAPGTDHTREDVPWLVAGARVRAGVGAPRSTLADIAATLADVWQLPAPAVGRSRWEELCS